MSLFHDELCAVASKKLKGVTVCALTDAKLSGIGTCTDIRVKKCGPLSTCTQNTADSFTYEGGSVDVSTCVADKTLVEALFAAVALVLLAIVVGGVFVFRHFARKTNIQQQLEQAARIAPRRSSV